MQTSLSPGGCITCSGLHYDRAKEAKDFDETKAGVKGLVDSGVAKVPRLFIHPPQNLRDLSSDTDRAAATALKVPVIDMMDYQGSRRQDVVDGLRRASETWGCFHIINHGIPVDAMDGMLEAAKRFHEQPEGVKREWYTRDDAKKFRYYSNGDLFLSKAATWKDTILFDFLFGVPDPEEVPLLCRSQITIYTASLHLRLRWKFLLSIYRVPSFSSKGKAKSFPHKFNIVSGRGISSSVLHASFIHL